MRAPVNLTRYWDPCTVATTERATELAREAVEAQYQEREARRASIGQAARRARGANAQKEFATVAALILDALAHHLTRDGTQLVIRLDKNWLSAGPKDVAARNRTVNERLQDLEQVGWLKANRKARINNRYMTTLECGPRLREAAERLSIGLEDIGLGWSNESIELRGKKPKGLNKPRPYISFKPTRHTLEISARVQQLNRHVDEMRIGQVGDGSARIDIRRRRVVRVFLDGSFERGGRTGGSAFWLSLDKARRKHALRLEGERIAEVDIVGAVPSIAYGLKRLRPEGDPYAIPGLPGAARDAIKVAVMQLLWSPQRRSGRLAAAARAGIPKRFTYNDVVAALRNRNQPIADVIGSDPPMGAELQWHESEIIIDASLRAFACGAPCLPLHDALLVPASRAEIAAEAIKQAFVARLGVEPAIKITQHSASPSDALKHA